MILVYKHGILYKFRLFYGLKVGYICDKIIFGERVCAVIGNSFPEEPVRMKIQYIRRMNSCCREM